MDTVYIEHSSQAANAIQSTPLLTSYIESLHATMDGWARGIKRAEADLGYYASIAAWSDDICAIVDELTFYIEEAKEEIAAIQDIIDTAT